MRGCTRGAGKRGPDGIEIELYTDEDPAIWKSNPQSVATIKTLDL